MDFAYTAYTEDKRLVKGKVSATTEEAASEGLSLTKKSWCRSSPR
jgi:hypothetical protein